MAIPANVGHGVVTGRFIDSTGANIAGNITFTPTPKRLLNTTAQPSPVTILPKPVTVALVEGSFTQSLIATDDPDNNPHGWTYSVAFNFVDAKADGFAIEVPEGQTVNLTTVAPVGSGNGTIILRGPGVPDWSDAEDGQVVVLVDGEPTWGPGGSGGVSSWTDLTDKPTTFPPATHTHSVANVTGLQTALDGKQAAGSYAAATHTHAVANVTGLQTALDAKADAAATTSALAGKAATSHTHSAATITGLAAAIFEIIGVAFVIYDPVTGWPARPNIDGPVFWLGGWRDGIPRPPMDDLIDMYLGKTAVG